MNIQAVNILKFTFNSLEFDRYEFSLFWRVYFAIVAKFVHFSCFLSCFVGMRNIEHLPFLLDKRDAIGKYLKLIKATQLIFLN
jgi:hypothetical protein